MTIALDQATDMQSLLELVVAQAESPTCFCGKSIGWKRWRMQLCDACSENQDLRMAAFHRVCVEKASDVQVLAMHEGVFVAQMLKYLSGIAQGK